MKQMTIKTKEELSQAILASFTKPPVTDLSQAKELAQVTAREIAEAIEQYTQYQIGLRLEEILTSIVIQPPSGQIVTISPGPTFTNFTRKTSS